MNTKNNDRFQKTDQKIKTAFLSELQNNSIEKIKVSSICRQAGINRSSFYAHFDNVFDILMKMSDSMGQELYEMFRKSSEKNESRIFGEEELLEFLNGIYEHREFYKLYFSAIPLEQLNSGLDQLFSELIFPKLADRGEHDETVGEFYFTFFKAGLFAVIKKWLLEDCRKTPREISQIILKSLNRSL